MSNKVCSPVVVENPIIPAIASGSAIFNYQSQKQDISGDPSCCSNEIIPSSCRITTSTCSSVSTSSNSFSHAERNTRYHTFNGKELAVQFEKLQFSADDHEEKTKNKRFSSRYSSALTLSAVKNKPIKKAVISKTNRRHKGSKSSQNVSKFVLKPSKLNRSVKAAFSRSYTDFYQNPPSNIQTESKVEKDLSIYHDFSEACSKELQTIALSSSSNESTLRPRSSSLPAAGASMLKSGPPSSPPTSSKYDNNALDITAASSSRKSRRKHLSKGDLKPSINDGNDNTSVETRGATRANKRRKSPPGSSATSFRLSIESTKNERGNSRDNLDASIDRLADYLEDSILLPKKMSYMAEMMYT